MGWRSMNETTSSNVPLTHKIRMDAVLGVGATVPAGEARWIPQCGMLSTMMAAMWVRVDACVNVVCRMVVQCPAHSILMGIKTLDENGASWHLL